jgi:hypothetical protein
MSKSWMKKTEPPVKTEEGKPANWKDCGYLTISKKGNVLSVVIKHQRYVVNLNEATEVIEGQREYTLIYEFVGVPRVKSGEEQPHAKSEVEKIG